MDSFEANKIFGAVLGTVFVLFGGSLLAENIFHSSAPEQPGYVIEAPEPGAGGAAEEVAAVPIAALLQTADAEAGATVFRRCQSCHSNEEGAPAGVGPHLWNVVNRPISEDPGFSYSTAMEAFSEGGTVIWDYEHLNGFLTNPRQYVSGTSMGFAGLSNDSDRANLIAYLRTLSNDPAPLPEPPAEEAAPAEGEAAAPAEGEAAPVPAEGEAAPAPAEAVTTPDATTDPNNSPQAPASTDPRASGAAPITETPPTTGQASDPAAAEPNVQAPAEGAEPAPAGEAPAGEAPAEAPAQAPAQPQGTTILPAQ